MNVIAKPYPWQAEQWHVLQESIRHQRLPHAWLFVGAVGLGKLDCGLYLAKTLLCLNNQFEPCNQCQSCHLFANDTHPDFHYISRIDSQIIKIEQVRRLIEFINQSKHISPMQVTVIHEADRLHRSAANALLKTLEEPGAGRVLILTATQLGSIPATIVSRCQQLHFQPAFEYQEDEPFNRAMSLTGFAPLQARELVSEDKLQQFSAFVTAIDGLVNEQITPSQLAESNKDIDNTQNLKWQSYLLECIILSKHAPRSSELQQFPELNQLVKSLDKVELKKCYYLWDEIQGLLRRQQIALNQQLMMEYCYIEWQKLKGVKHVRAQRERMHIG